MLIPLKLGLGHFHWKPIILWISDSLQWESWAHTALTSAIIAPMAGYVPPIRACSRTPMMTTHRSGLMNLQRWLSLVYLWRILFSVESSWAGFCKMAKRNYNYWSPSFYVNSNLLIGCNNIVKPARVIGTIEISKLLHLFSSLSNWHQR